MKIGIVLSTTPGYSETFFRSKIKGLQKNGMEVCLFCQNNKEDFPLCPIVESPKVGRNPVLQANYFIIEFIQLLPYLSTVIRYVKLELKEGTGWAQLFKKIYLNSHLLKAKLDWLHFGFATQALGSETVAKAIGAKMAVSFRGFDIAVYPVKHPNCYKLLWKYVDKIHTISDSLVSLAKSHGMTDNIPTKKITPAIDINLFHISSHSSTKPEKTTFITIGRLHWIKGYVEVLEALAILRSQGLDFSYRIVGDGKEYERIAFAAHQLGLKENVEFLGKLPHGEIKKELEAADIYLQYSLHEGFCNAVLEAQAMGKLCIVCGTGGLLENVAHGQTGWVVPKYSPELLAEQIKKVFLMDEVEKNRISCNAVERVRKEFNIDKQQQEFLNFYGVHNESSAFSASLR